MENTSLPQPARRPERVLVVDGHPRADSFCHALVTAFGEGAEESGHEVRVLTLRDLDFDPDERGQPLEDHLVASQKALLWADHIALVCPVWWGTMPALLKGWLDRVLSPGFAFEERQDGGFEGLLGGRTADIILTMDTPLWVFRGLLHAPGLRALRDATFRFCGIGPVQTLLLGPVRLSDQWQREAWLAKAADTGRRLETRFHTGGWARAKKWAKAARPQFYVFPALALAAGAVLGAAYYPGQGSWLVALLALMGIWLVEFITVITNEIHDIKTDEINENASLFTGGFGMLAEGEMTVQELKRGRFLAVCLLWCLSLGTAAMLPAMSALQLETLLILGLAMGIGYSVPPVKLSYRGCGEVAVAFSHSALVVLVGYVSQGGWWLDWPVWLLIWPMLLAIFPSIILAGVPDYDADCRAGKGTWAVRLGKIRATWGALGFTAGAVLLHLMILSPSVPWIITVFMGLHAVLLGVRLVEFARRPREGRIDGLLVWALSYMVWFALGPLLARWPQ